MIEEDVIEETQEKKHQIVNLEFDCYEFFKFIEALNKFTDEIELVFENREFSITFMDASRIMLCKCTKHLPNDYGGAELLDKMVFGVATGDLMAILRTRKSDNKQIEMIFDNNNQYIEFIKTSEKYNSRIERTLMLLDIELEEIPFNNLLKIDYSSKGVFPIDFLNDFFYESGLYAEIVNIHIDEDVGIIISESGQIGKSEYIIESQYCSNIMGNENGSYSYTFLTPIKPILAILDKDNEITMHIKTDHPIKLELPIKSLDIDMRIFLAPRCEEEEYKDDDDDEW